MVEPTDAELMTRVAASDSEALEALYDRHASLALGLALRILGERSIAEEILQEAFWRVWQNAETFDPGRGKVLTWIFGIVRNLAIDELRKRGRRPPRAEPGEDNRLNHIAAEGAVAEQVGMRLERVQVRAALARLPDAQRLVLEMAYFEGLTHREIAARLEEPLGTIHSRARIGLLKLRELLAELRVTER